ncbi:hypothetical protein [Pseudomonas putida]|nr:hypothetical protein [Pseudomonas putida]
MDNLNSLKASQDFLDRFYLAGLQHHRSAPFLKDDFESDVWKLEFGQSSTFDIDFNISIGGVQLPACLNGKLCDFFKMWICAAGTNSNPTCTLSNSTMLAKVTYATTAIDWLLINNDRFFIHKHGLKLVGNNDLKVLFARGCSSPYLSTVAYDWPSKLTSFIVDLRNSTTTFELESILDSFPALTESHIDSGDGDTELNRTLQEQFASEQEMFLARAALWKAGLYRRTRQSLFSVDTQKISRILYKNTLRGVKTYPVPSALPVGRPNLKSPEYIRTPVSGKHSSLSTPLTIQLLATFEIVNRINDHSSLLPAHGIDIPTIEQLEQHLDFSKAGRFTSLPVELVLKSLKDSIEFYIDYGDAIISSYLSMMTAFIQKSETFKSTAKSQLDISSHIDSKLLSFNIKVWNKIQRPSDNQTVEHLERFRSLRSSPSLHELIQVLFGAIQLTLGALQARRASELRALVSTKCLSFDQRSLETINRKTGLYGHNVKITRPIPQIAADMLLSLERMQHCLFELELIREHTNILACPNINAKLGRVTHNAFDFKLDMFCDYFETERDPSGRRYYFRNHQLRRFFAQVFFWNSNTPDCLEVLRWILGHGDSEMVYHYITESTPGQVLREVKAEWGAQMLRSAPEKVSDLAEYVLKKYNISDFAILPEDQLEEYLYYCLSNHSIEVEPEFLTTHDGDSYRITVTVLDKGKHQ